MPTMMTPMPTIMTPMPTIMTHMPTTMTPMSKTSTPSVPQSCPPATGHDGCSPAEIVYLVEYSKDESSSDVDHEGLYISQMVDKYKMGSDHIRLGVVIYNDDVTESIHITDFPDDKEGLKTRIRGLTRAPWCDGWFCRNRHPSELTPRGDANLAKAFDYAREHSFANARPGAMKLVHVIFHSMATFGDRLEEIKLAAERLRKECVILYASVVSDRDSQLDKNAIRSMVTQPWTNHYFEFIGFSCRWNCLDTNVKYINFNC